MLLSTIILRPNTSLAVVDADVAQLAEVGEEEHEVLDVELNGSRVVVDFEALVEFPRVPLVERPLM